MLWWMNYKVANYVSKPQVYIFFPGHEIQIVAALKNPNFQKVLNGEKKKKTLRKKKSPK